MHDSIVMQVLQGTTNLIRQFLDSALGELKLSELDVVEEVFALHELEHYVVVIAILEQVDKRHDVWVLTHLQHVDLHSLLIHLDRLHILLMDRLDSYFLSGFDVSRQFHETELALAKIVFQSVVVVQVGVADD